MGNRKNPLDMIDALIGGSGDDARQPRKVKGRSVLLVHAMAQRENRMKAEKRAAATRLNGGEDDEQPTRKDTPKAQATASGRHTDTGSRGRAPVQRQASAAARPAVETPQGRRVEPARKLASPTSLDAMIVKALGTAAHDHVRDGSFDRESALTDLIARTQDRLSTDGEPDRLADMSASPARHSPVPRGDRESMIAEAMRTHREQQAVFGELSLRQRATLRATAEAMVQKTVNGRK